MGLVRRGLFTITAIVSLTLCILTMALWARSYWIIDSFDWDRPYARLGISSFRGSLWWNHIRYTKTDRIRFSRGPGYHRDRAAGIPADGAPAIWSFAGFRWVNYNLNLKPAGTGIVVQALRIPDWPLTSATLILPVLWLVSRRAAIRPPRGHCRTCGYNLTGNTSGVCPECGTPTTAGVKA